MPGNEVLRDSGVSWGKGSKLKDELWRHVLLLLGIAAVASGVVVGAEIAKAVLTTSSLDGTISLLEERTWRFVGIVVQVAAVAVAAWAVGHQIAKQLDGSRRLQRESARFRLDIYEPLNNKVSDAVHASSGVLGISSSLANYVHTTQQGNPVPPRMSLEDVLDGHKRSHDAFIDVLGLLEAHDSLHTRFGLFRLALASGIHDLREQHQRLFNLIALRLPPRADMPQQFATQVPTKDELEKIDTTVWAYWNAEEQVCAWLADIRTDAQNEFVYLFESKAPTRQPLDPKEIVLSGVDADRQAELERYFNDETPMGRARQGHRGTSEKATQRRRGGGTACLTGRSHSDVEAGLIHRDGGSESPLNRLPVVTLWSLSRTGGQSALD